MRARTFMHWQPPPGNSDYRIQTASRRHRGLFSSVHLLAWHVWPQATPRHGCRSQRCHANWPHLLANHCYSLKTCPVKDPDAKTYPNIPGDVSWDYKSFHRFPTWAYLPRSRRLSSSWPCFPYEELGLMAGSLCFLFFLYSRCLWTKNSSGPSRWNPDCFTINSCSSTKHEEEESFWVVTQMTVMWVVSATQHPTATLFPELFDAVAHQLLTSSWR